jgi:hypothetical protein
MSKLKRGLCCKRCGHKCEKAKSKTVKGDKMEVCPACDWPGTLEPFEQPLNERSGRCRNCAGGAFTLAMGKNKLAGQMLRCCKQCGEVINPDHPNDILKKGDPKHEYKQH